MHAILRQIVGMVLNSPECAPLQRYIVLKREIATVAAASLEKVCCRAALCLCSLPFITDQPHIHPSCCGGVSVDIEPC